MGALEEAQRGTMTLDEREHGVFTIRPWHAPIAGWSEKEHWGALFSPQWQWNLGTMTGNAYHASYTLQLGEKILQAYNRSL